MIFRLCLRGPTLSTLKPPAVRVQEVMQPTRFYYTMDDAPVFFLRKIHYAKLWVILFPETFDPGELLTTVQVFPVTWSGSSYYFMPECALSEFVINYSSSWHIRRCRLQLSTCRLPPTRMPRIWLDGHMTRYLDMSGTTLQNIASQYIIDTITFLYCIMKYLTFGVDWGPTTMCRSTPGDPMNWICDQSVFSMGSTSIQFLIEYIPGLMDLWLGQFCDQLYRLRETCIGSSRPACSQKWWGLDFRNIMNITLIIIPSWSKSLLFIIKYEELCKKKVVSVHFRPTFCPQLTEFIGRFSNYDFWNLWKIWDRYT